MVHYARGFESCSAPKGVGRTTLFQARSLLSGRQTYHPGFVITADDPLTSRVQFNFCSVLTEFFDPLASNDPTSDLLTVYWRVFSEFDGNCDEKRDEDFNASLISL